MTLGRVTQLPASRGQAGYRAQAMFTSHRALANEVGMPLVLLGRAEEEFRLIAVCLRCHSRHGARDCVSFVPAANHGVPGVLTRHDRPGRRLSPRAWCDCCCDSRSDSKDRGSLHPRSRVSPAARIRLSLEAY